MIGKETKNAQEQVQARSNIRQRIVSEVLTNGRSVPPEVRSEHFQYTPLPYASSSLVENPLLFPA